MVIVIKDKCYLDKQGIFHACQLDDGDCIGCKYEKVIARSFASLCHWCGETIEANRTRAFCNDDHRRQWLSARLPWVNLSEEQPFWTEGFGTNPIYNEDELEECQRQMLGHLSPAYIETKIATKRCCQGG
ncbi:hypothetical protein MUP77_17540 [Candidatus Bathyarchaeota archaeon]|nr:hypothetical protein [Candidatus Bathyarchaeota archaeon]